MRSTLVGIPFCLWNSYAEPSQVLLRLRTKPCFTRYPAIFVQSGEFQQSQLGLRFLADRRS